MCAAEFLCALDVFARHTSSRITFLTLTIVGRSRGDVSSHQDIFQTFGFPESQDGWLGVFVWLSSAHERCWKHYWAQNGMWWQMTLCWSCSFLYFGWGLSIPLALLKQWFNVRRWHFSSPSRFLVVCSLEQMRLIRRAWLYGILLVQWLGWQLCGDRYWCLSVGLLYMSVDIIPFSQVV